MQTAKLTDLATPSTRAGETRPRAPLLLRVLTLIVEADARYRQKRALKSLPDARLADMGLTRRDAEGAFKRRPAKR